MSDAREELARLIWEACRRAGPRFHIYPIWQDVGPESRKATYAAADAILAAGYSKRTPGGEAGRTSDDLAKRARTYVDAWQGLNDLVVGPAMMVSLLDEIAFAHEQAVLSARPAGEGAGVAEQDRADVLNAAIEWHAPDVVTITVDAVSGLIFAARASQPSAGEVK